MPKVTTIMVLSDEPYSGRMSTRSTARANTGATTARTTTRARTGFHPQPCQSCQYR